MPFHDCGEISDISEGRFIFRSQIQDEVRKNLHFTKNDSISKKRGIRLTEGWELLIHINVLFESECIFVHPLQSCFTEMLHFWLVLKSCLFLNKNVLVCHFGSFEIFNSFLRMTRLSNSAENRLTFTQTKYAVFMETTKHVRIQPKGAYSIGNLLISLHQQRFSCRCIKCTVRNYDTGQLDARLFSHFGLFFFAKISVSSEELN